jgi:hypothetical protein
MAKTIRMLLSTSVVLGILLVVPLANAASPWAAWTSYSVGSQVTYNGLTYEALQAHTSQPGWEPPNVPALWRLIGSSPSNTTTPTRTATRTNTPLGPTVTPTRTPTRTNTPVGPTATATRTPTRTNTVAGSTASATPTRTNTLVAHTNTPTRTNTALPPTFTPTTSGSGCWTAWAAGNTYTTGNQVSRNSQNYQAAFWSQGSDPATNSGPVGSGQPWIPMNACGAPTSTNTPSGPTATTPAGSIPATVSMLYADVSFTSVQAAYQSTGHKYYALSFVLGNNHECVPAWDGTHPMSENFYASEINAIRAGGGDVSAVFGGVNGSDMATVCTTVSSLQAAYQSVINQYQFKWIDLNVEGSIIADSISIDRRNKAVAALQAANPNLRISYTLPVTQSGLLQTALDLLSNAKANGVRVDYVNIMTMNYGPSGIDMGQAAMDAATNTRNQLVGLGLSSTKIGITPMIGQNNTAGEIFDLVDADQLINFARANSYVGWLSFWSLGRDNGGCPGQTTASASCSGISQGAYAFTTKFKAYP